MSLRSTGFAMHRLLTLAACLAGLLACGPGYAGDEGTRVRKFREIIGLGVKFSQGQPQTGLADLTQLRVRWVRDTLSWPELEPAPGQFIEFPSAFRKRLEFYREHDIGVVFLLGYGNPHAYPPTAQAPFRSVDPVAFGAYAAEVARQLKKAGVRFALDIWNEPHNFVLGPLLGGQWNGRPPSPWVDHYVRMIKEAVKQVKAVDPTIKLLSDDDMWVLHYWFLEAGLPKELDGFAFHPYTNESSLGPEMSAVSDTTEWAKPFTLVDADRSFNSAVRRLREHGRIKLAKTPEMWITEWGWAIGQQTPFGPVTEEMAAALLPRAFIVAEAAGVEVLCWFSAQDSVDGPMGLSTNDGRRRKSFFALQTLSEQLGDYVFVRQVEGAQHPTSGAQAFLFRGERDSKLAVWNLAPSRTLLRLTGALAGARALDVLGARVAAEFDAAGVPYLSIGDSPLYLAGVRGDASIKLDFASPRAAHTSDAALQP